MQQTTELVPTNGISENVFQFSILQQGIIYLSTLFPTAAVFMYGFLGSFNRLLGDSFCSFYHAKNLGLLRSIWYWRLNWSGRYSAYAFDWLVLKLFGSNIQLLIPIVLCIWVVANTAVVYLLLNSKKHEFRYAHVHLILGPVSVFVILTISPYVEQSFIWIDGFRAYTLPVILLAVYLALYLAFANRINKRSRLAASILSFFFFYISGGLSETFAIFQLALFLFWIVYVLIVERTKETLKLQLLVVGFIGTLASFLTIVTAPGNAVRQGMFPPPPGLLELTKISLAGYGEVLGSIFLTPEKIMALFGSVVLSAWVGSVYNGSITLRGRKILLQIAGAVLLPISCIVPGAYVYGEAPPERVLIISTFIMSVLAMSSAFLAGNLSRQIAFPMGRKFLLPIAILLLSFSSLSNVDILFNSRAEYARYAQSWDDVDHLIKQARSDGRDSIEITEMMPNWAGINQPIPNPKFWVNRCYSSFYGIEVIGPP